MWYVVEAEENEFEVHYLLISLNMPCGNVICGHMQEVFDVGVGNVATECFRKSSFSYFERIIILQDKNCT